MFESTIANLLPGNSVVGRYALSGFSVSLFGTVGKTYSMGPVGDRIIEITNHFSDAYKVSLSRIELTQPQALVGDPINGFGPRAFSLSIAGGNLFNNDSLSLVPPSLDGNATSFTMTFFSGADAVLANGRLTSLGVATVPEPGALLLLGSGLLGLIGVRIVHRRNGLNQS